MTSRPGPSGTREVGGADDLEAPGMGECEPISRPRLYKIAHSARFLQSGPLANSTGSLGRRGPFADRGRGLASWAAIGRAARSRKTARVKCVSSDYS
jgi:hypothetical protein